MVETDVLRILTACGMLDDDFSLKNKDAKNALHPHTAELFRFCRAIAGRFAEEGVEAVLGPALGGIVVSWCTAYHLSDITKQNVPSYYADKLGESQAFRIRRGFDDAIAGKNVLVTEDVLVTGETAKRVIEEARRLNCEVVGLASICDCVGIKPRDVGDVRNIFTLLNLSAVKRGGVAHISSCLPSLQWF